VKETKHFLFRDLISSVRICQTNSQKLCHPPSPIEDAKNITLKTKINQTAIFKWGLTSYVSIGHGFPTSYGSKEIFFDATTEISKIKLCKMFDVFYYYCNNMHIQTLNIFNPKSV
jgi:hypothetical protein